MLGMPQINWQEVKDGKGTGIIDNRGSSSSNYAASASDERHDTFVEEEEFLKNAPPHIRQRLANAEIIESREKGKIIDEIVANIVDEAQEQRMRNLLGNKSLAELREYLVLAPRKETTRPSYFGSAVPLAGQVAANRAADASEDILPIPKMDYQEISRKQA